MGGKEPIDEFEAHMKDSRLYQGILRAHVGYQRYDERGSPISFYEGIEMLGVE